VSTTTPPDTRRAGFRDVVGVAEFRSLWFAEILSVCGDQLARVAPSVIVSGRTGSVARLFEIFELVPRPTEVES
jgi:hypothetical protein